MDARGSHRRPTSRRHYARDPRRLGPSAVVHERGGFSGGRCNRGALSLSHLLRVACARQFPADRRHGLPLAVVAGGSAFPVRVCPRGQAEAARRPRPGGGARSVAGRAGSAGEDWTQEHRRHEAWQLLEHTCEPHEKTSLIRTNIRLAAFQRARGQRPDGPRRTLPRRGAGRPRRRDAIRRPRYVLASARKETGRRSAPLGAPPGPPASPTARFRRGQARKAVSLTCRPMPAPRR